jgi:hypothetical protein
LFPLLFLKVPKNNPLANEEAMFDFWGILRNEDDFGRNCLAWEIIVI